jgi:hypothetical protein
MLSILGPERVKRMRQLANSLEVEARGDVTEAALGLLLMVECFPCQLGHLFPESGRVHERVKASVEVFQSHSQATIYDVSQRTKRARCDWKGCAQEVVTKAEGWRRHADVTNLERVLHAQQEQREETQERMASGGVMPPESVISGPPPSTGLKHAASASSKEPGTSEPDDVTLCYACNHELPLATRGCETAVIHRVVRRHIRGKRPRETVTRRDLMRWRPTAAPRSDHLMASMEAGGEVFPSIDELQAEWEIALGAVLPSPPTPSCPITPFTPAAGPAAAAAAAAE